MKGKIDKLHVSIVVQRHKFAHSHRTSRVTCGWCALWCHGDRTVVDKIGVVPRRHAADWCRHGLSRHWHRSVRRWYHLVDVLTIGIICRSVLRHLKLQLRNRWWLWHRNLPAHCSWNLEVCHFTVPMVWRTSVGDILLMRRRCILILGHHVSMGEHRRDRSQK